MALRKNGVLHWLTGDHLGSTAVTAYDDGTKGAELRYHAWGENRYTSGSTPTSYRFTGQREDDTIGLYFYNARYYDPALGRFVQADTIVPEPGNPQDLNRYSYVRNNSLTHTDTSGHCIDGVVTTWICIAVGAGLIGLGVDMLVAEHVEHEDYSVERGAVAFTVNAVGGLVGGYLIPGASGLAGQGATKMATSLGASEVAVQAVGTGTTIAADATLAGSTNTILGAVQRTLNRAIEGEHVTEQDVANDLDQNWKRDMSFGVVSSLFGQALNGLISANTTGVSPGTGVGPPEIGNVHPSYGFVSQRTTVLPMNYTRWTPYIRGGLQSLASAFSDASALDLGSTLIERFLSPQPPISPSPSPQRTPVPY